MVAGVLMPHGYTPMPLGVKPSARPYEPLETREARAGTSLPPGWFSLGTARVPPRGRR